MSSPGSWRRSAPEGRERSPSSQLGAKDCIPEVARVKFHWNMPRKIHWTLPVRIHWGSDNPLEHATENPRCFLRC